MTRYSEKDLRSAKDEGLTRIVEQQKRFGMVPNVEAAEAFVRPLVHNMERKGRPAPPKRVTADETEERIIRPGQAIRPGDGKLTGLGRKRGVNVPDGAIIRCGPVRDVPPIPKTRAQKAEVALRAIFHVMRKRPEWKEKVIKTMESASSFRDACNSCRPKGKIFCACEAYMNLAEDFVRYYGDPRSEVQKGHRVQVDSIGIHGTKKA